MSLIASSWPQAFAVAGGAAIGALARWRMGVWLAPFSHVFPLGTLAVNLLGGLAIGMAMAWVARSSLLHLFIVTGVLGGFTTFSAFSAESLGMLQRGQWTAATMHAASHVLGALVCTWLGFALARALVRA